MIKKQQNKQHLIDLCNKVCQFCHPLADLFNINYFAYHRNYADNKKFLLSSRSDITEYYFTVNADYYMNSILDIKQSGHFFLDDVDQHSDCAINVISPLAKKFNTSHIIINVRHFKQYSEILAYGVPINYIEFNRDFLIHQNFFDYFTLHFKDQAKKIIEEAKNYCYKFKSFPKLNMKDRQDIIRDKIKTYENASQINRFYLSGEYEDIYLTRKELDCLVLFYNTTNYQVIAKQLNLSAITIQRHFDSIRTKLKCNNKKELIKIVKKLDPSLLVTQQELTTNTKLIFQDREDSISEFQSEIID